MNPIDRATAQQKKLSPVWEFKIKDNFKLKEPYRFVETDTHGLIIRPKKDRSFAETIRGLLKPEPNIYEYQLASNEEIERAIPREDYVLTSYLYYDDPEETDEQRRNYIESLDINKANFTLFPLGSAGELIGRSREIISVKRVKNETPFNYQSNSIK